MLTQNKHFHGFSHLCTFTSSGFSMDCRRRAGSSHEGAETHSTEVHDVRHSEGQLREK